MKINNFRTTCRLLTFLKTSVHLTMTEKDNTLQSSISCCSTQLKEITRSVQAFRTVILKYFNT